MVELRCQGILVYDVVAFYLGYSGLVQRQWLFWCSLFLPILKLSCYTLAASFFASPSTAFFFTHCCLGLWATVLAGSLSFGSVLFFLWLIAEEGFGEAEGRAGYSVGF
jgi:hypothetical protein